MKKKQKQPLAKDKAVSVELAIKVLHQREEELRYEHQCIERFKKSILEMIAQITSHEGKVQFGVIDNVLIGTKYCFVCGHQIEADMAVGCILGLSDIWQYVCNKCLDDFAPELTRKLEKALDERYKVRFGKDYKEVHKENSMDYDGPF